MHHALMNGVIVDEIIRQITRHDEPDSEIKELGLLLPSARGASSARTLYALALTCRTLSPNALKALWRVLDDLTPLFKIFPGFRGKYFDGPLLGPQLVRFEEYANKVKFYKCQGKGRIGSSAYIQLMRARKTQTLLPRLQYLSTTASYPELQYFASSSLCVLCCSPPVTGALPFDIWTLIQTCATSKKPSLQYLKLNLFLSDSCLRSIKQLSSLKYLALYNPVERSMTLDSKFFKRISKFKNLTQLVLTTGSFFLSTEDLSASDLPAFPALNNLWISPHPNQLPNIIHFLDVGKFEGLETLWLKFPPVADDGWKDIVAMPWIHFFNILRMKTSPLFNSLVIESPYFDLETPTSEWPTLSLSDVPDFFHLKLTRLRIVFPIFSTISNTDIYKMTSSFPALISLDLVTQLPWQADFMAMIDIARGHLDLRELSLGLDTHSLPEESQVPLLSRPLCGLKLVIYRLEDPDQFAFYLDRMFHEVQTFDVHGCGSSFDDPVQKRALEEVEEAKRSLAQLSSVRADQTRRLSTDPHLRLAHSQTRLNPPNGEYLISFR